MPLLPTLTVHIGPHKTGTTFLQKVVFPEINGAEYWGRYGCPPRLGQSGYYEFMHWVCGGDSKAKNDFIKALEKSNNSILISEEWLTSEFSGRYFPKAPWQKKIRRIAELRAYADIKVVYCRREPAEAVASLYREFFQEGVLATKNLDLLKFAETSNSSFYNFDRSHEELVRYFGKDSVCWFRYRAVGFEKSDLSHCFRGILSFDGTCRVNVKHRTEGGFLVVRKNASLSTFVGVVAKAAPWLAKNSLVHAAYSAINKITSIQTEVTEPSAEEKRILNEYFQWDG